MKLDLSKIKRVTPVKNNFKTKSFVLDEIDEFEREDEQRKQEFGTDPDELRPMLNMSGDPDYSDPKVAELRSRSVSEVICPTEFLWVARNFECLCGAIHR